MMELKNEALQRWLLKGQSRKAIPTLFRFEHETMARRSHRKAGRL
jgi:hypothetical protein